MSDDYCGGDTGSSNYSDSNNSCHSHTESTRHSCNTESSGTSWFNNGLNDTYYDTPASTGTRRSSNSHGNKYPARPSAIKSRAASEYRTTAGYHSDGRRKGIPMWPFIVGSVAAAVALVFILS